MLKNRVKKFILVNLTVIAAGMILILTRIWILHSQNEVLNLIIECPMHFIFNIYCPGCGGTRALMALLHLDIISALKYNAFAVYLVCLFIYLDILSLVKILKNKRCVFPKAPAIITVVFMVLFFVARNIVAFNFGVDYLILSVMS